jgi:cell wall-associated NlpC family hydrolase
VSGAAISFALDDPERFLADLDRLIAASDSQSAALARTYANAVKLKEASDALSREKSELVAATAALGEQQALAATKLAEAWQTVAAMEEAERQRLAEEIRQAQETSRLEAAAARQALSAAAGPQTTTAPGTVESLSGSGSAATTGTTNGAVGTGAIRQVIDFALSKVGGPYVWGANGPDAYDCSGLTQVAWAQAGVRLTHYSGTQYNETTPVALNAIQPGDLLYFYSIQQHVGLYIGDGKFVHAANSSDGIRLDSLSGHYLDNFVAASRPGV